MVWLLYESIGFQNKKSYIQLSGVVWTAFQGMQGMKRPFDTGQKPQTVVVHQLSPSRLLLTQVALPQLCSSPTTLQSLFGTCVQATKHGR